MAAEIEKNSESQRNAKLENDDEERDLDVETNFADVPESRTPEVVEEAPWQQPRSRNHRYLPPAPTQSSWRKVRQPPPVLPNQQQGPRPLHHGPSRQQQQQGSRKEKKLSPQPVEAPRIPPLVIPANHQKLTSPPHQVDQQHRYPPHQQVQQDESPPKFNFNVNASEFVPLSAQRAPSQNRQHGRRLQPAMQGPMMQQVGQVPVNYQGPMGWHMVPNPMVQQPQTQYLPPGYVNLNQYFPPGYVNLNHYFPPGYVNLSQYIPPGYVNLSQYSEYMKANGLISSVRR